MPVLLMTGIQDDVVEKILVALSPDASAALTDALADYAKLKDYDPTIHTTIWFMPANDPDCVKLMALH